MLPVRCSRTLAAPPQPWRRPRCASP